MDFEYANAGEANQFSAEFAKWATIKLSGRRDGIFPNKSVLAGIEKYGLCREELMPMKSATSKKNTALGLDQPSKEAKKDAASRKKSMVKWIHFDTTSALGFTESEVEAICRSIAEEHPVAISTKWPKSTDAAEFQQTHTIDAKNCPAQLALAKDGVAGHNVVLVGYEKGKQWEGGGRLEFLNSFGEGWGERGYGWFTFGYMKKYGFRAYSIHSSS